MHAALGILNAHAPRLGGVAIICMQVTCSVESLQNNAVEGKLVGWCELFDFLQPSVRHLYNSCVNRVSVATMTVRVDRKSSLTTLLCTVLFVTWVFHVGRSQVDQESISSAVCKDPIVNSFVPIPDWDFCKC